jgi:hypothetical protein
MAKKTDYLAEDISQSPDDIKTDIVRRQKELAPT